MDGWIDFERRESERAWGGAEGEGEKNAKQTLHERGA